MTRKDSDRSREESFSEVIEAADGWTGSDRGGD
jgi:hypothetical protein